MRRTVPKLASAALLAGAMALTATPAVEAGEVAASATEIRPLLIGAEVPDVTLRDVEGKAAPLRKVVSAKPTAIIFYRGGW